MSILSRFANAFRSHVDDGIDTKLQSHFDEAEVESRARSDTSQAFFSRQRAQEAVRDVIASPWPESLIADAVFGWRQLLKHNTASAAAILSLALGIGASMAAFQLIEALFLRPLPLAHPERLYVLTYESLFDGKFSTSDQFDYPGFRLLRAAVADQAELMAVALPDRIVLTFGNDRDPERASRQYVSGWMFGEFGLHPALGRLFTERDDLTPGAHPYTVISYDYWWRRFGKDPSIVGRRFRMGSEVLEIVGVAPEGFTGTDPGTFTDMFLPNMMNVADVSGSLGVYRTVYRIWVNPKPGSSLEAIRQRLRGALHAYRAEQVKTWPVQRTQQERDWFAASPVSLDPAGAGRSFTQRRYRPALTILAMLGGLVLLIACANTASLMTAQTAARAREMALRVSIGAGRARLVQLVLMESAIVAMAASALGLACSWWAAPFVVNQLNSSFSPVRLTLRADWRVTTFALALTCVITLLFGLAPALRASSITPVSALKGSDDPHGRRRLMNALVAAQVAFSLLVLFVAALFIATFERMANQPTGFSSVRLLTLQSESRAELSTERWYQAVQQVRSLPGVESAALAHTALMAGNARNSIVWANGQAPDETFLNRTWLLGVSPGWFDTMGVQLVEGRDLGWDESGANVAVVNETFARRYFGGQSPVGQTFETLSGFGGLERAQGTARVVVRIVGLVRDVRYEDMRLPVPATAYIPLRALLNSEGKQTNVTFIVRTKTADPTALASMLRQEIPKARPEIRVANIVTQEELVRTQMIRERLLATLSLFFGAVALILAAVGLYGVLNYAVLERRRELGIRIALGAQGSAIVWQVTAEVLSMLALGTAVGLALGVAAERYVASLLYQVNATDPSILALPTILMSAVALLAALPPVLRAIHFDPAALLRAE